MGNMLINKRVEDSIAGEPAPGTPEYRIFPDHMYKVNIEKSSILSWYIFMICV